MPLLQIQGPDQARFSETSLGDSSHAEEGGTMIGVIALAMWVSMVFTGGITQEIIKKNSINSDVIANYHIEIKPNGELIRVCEEAK